MPQPTAMPLCQPSKQALVKPRHAPSSMLSCGFQIGCSMLAALLDQMSCHGSLATKELCSADDGIRVLLLACLIGADLQAQQQINSHHGVVC